jgi:alpha-glucosidase
MSTAAPWWKAGVCYQIYPRSFMDSDGDGVGDLRGIIDRLDYLNDGTEQSLGVDALWLSPIYPSPQKDFGYDISDFCAIDPVFGTMDDFRELVDQAHARGMRIIMDWVVNHTSDQHPWFVASRSSRTDEKRDWYLWRDSVNGRPPNNWASTFGGSGWTWDLATAQFYFHSFLDSQPDLNWRNPAVQQAILDAMRFWLDLGVDGFRHDVFNCYFKDADFRSNPRRLNPAGWVYSYIGQRHIYDRDRPEMREALDAMRGVLDAYQDRMMVGETLDDDSRYARAASYCDTPGKALHLAFNFHLLRSRWGARRFGRAIRAWNDALPEGWPTWVLSNHDFRRQFSRFDRGRHGEARSKLAAILLMTLRGVPFLYYGEEIGMAEGRLRRAEIMDPPGRLFWPFFKGRDGCRTPMQWDPSAHGGFTTGTPWLRVNPDWQQKNVAAQRDDPDSLLGVYRRLIWLRKKHPVLQSGTMTFPREDHPKVLTWRRDLGDAAVRVVLNMTPRPVDFPRREKTYAVLFGTHFGADVSGTGAMRLRPLEGLVLDIEREGA